MHVNIIEHKFRNCKSPNKTGIWKQNSTDSGLRDFLSDEVSDNLDGYLSTTIEEDNYNNYYNENDDEYEYVNPDEINYR